MSRWNLLRAETMKVLGDAKAYWFNLIFGNLNIFFLFLGIFYAFTGESSDHNQIFSMLIGLMVWYYGVHAIDLVALIIEEEAEEGTLEQIFMTRTNFIIVLMNRIISQIVFDTIKGIFVFTLCIITFKISPEFILSVNWFWTLVIFFISLAGLYGIGYIVAGLSLVYKKTSAIAGAFSNILLFFTGVIIDVNKLPVIFQFLSKILPLYWGMKTLDELVISDFNIVQVITGSSFITLMVSVVVWILIGVTVFECFKKKAIARGTLNQY